MTLPPNPVLKKLGLKETDRTIIIHADDVGMCHASAEAFVDLYEAGAISSGAVMVPCPWFLHVAEYARQHPEVDLGVHLTLTSEWRTYRWGPISTREAASGLLDEQGYFPARVEPVQEKGDAEAVAVELASQIERARLVGLKPTHADTHMGTVLHPKLVGLYLSITLQQHVLPMLVRMDEVGWRAMGLEVEFARQAEALVLQMEEAGLPLVDAIRGVPLEISKARPEHTRQVLVNLPPGITHFIIHPSKDTPELRAITPDWPSRVADYEIFLQEDLHHAIRQLGLQVIGYRALQQLMPAQ